MTRAPWRAAAAVSLVLLAAGCGAGAGAPAATSPTRASAEPGSSHRIPDDFPIDTGFAEGGGKPGEPVRGDTSGPMDICGEFVWKLPLDRLTSGRENGDTGAESHQVLLFGSPALARSELAHLRTRTEACHSEVFTDRSGAHSEAHYELLHPDLPAGADTVGRHSGFGDDYADGWVAVRRGPAIVMITMTTGGPDATGVLEAQLGASARSLYATLCELPQVTC